MFVAPVYKVVVTHYNSFNTAKKNFETGTYSSLIIDAFFINKSLKIGTYAYAGNIKILPFLCQIFGACNNFSSVFTINEWKHFDLPSWAEFSSISSESCNLPPVHGLMISPGKQLKN